MVKVEAMLELKHLLEKHVQEENLVLESPIKDFFVYKSTKPTKAKCCRHHEIYEPGIAILASGQKRCYVNGHCYDYSAGSYLGVFLPMPVEVEEIKVSPEEPLLMVAVKMDLGKIAEMLLKLDSIESPKIKDIESAGIFTAPLEEDLLDPVLRLLRIFDKPTDVAILGENLIEEIYYRVLTSEGVSAIRGLLEHRGQIQQISRAVAHINKHLSEAVIIDDLAAKANMSVSHFHKTFKDVMQMSPLQYAKSMKLLRAQTFLREGKKVSQVAYMVGYNSSTQFSREYKRQFGVAPSEAN
ncbi:MAG: AraC family transcriptional regulator [Deinococcales bacterium]